MKQSTNDRLQELLAELEAELVNHVPAARDRIMRRACALYWQGIIDAIAEPGEDWQDLEP